MPPTNSQPRQIKLKNQDINYTLKTSLKAKRMRMTVYCDGSLVVTRPWSMNEGRVEKFIEQKARWVISKIEQFRKVGFRPVVIHGKKHYRKHKEQARQFVQERLTFYNTLYNVAYNKINIRNQKTRWGSCSAKKNLNFNYKVLFLPKYLADYIIVHELCHLIEFNHSQKFWNLVKRTMPDYKKMRKELRKNGITNVC